MTDPELESAFAEKVLSQGCGPGVLTDFHPLTSLDDAFEGLAAHPEWEWNLQRIRNHVEGWNTHQVTILTEQHVERAVHGNHESLPRAIVLACLRAKGIDV